ncbi:uncharacterized protein LOC132039180 [Lycium ferocissimum]|uniref:uncharacterized protein LOC132039180 n=1 Tax=Lycium ferocissimum TaxID=112874 RepID=UPI0028160B65|nr:uncharacterized protein LOC132039180 [Lycium ferocissimum]
MHWNRYCWTIEHQKDLLKNDLPNLPKEKFYVLCRVRKLYLNYYLMEDGISWRFFNRTYFNHHIVKQLCCDIEEQDTWFNKFSQMLEHLHVPLWYQLDMVRDIINKASLILQEYEKPRRIPIVVDIIHRVPQIISKPYQDYHEEADEDEIELIEQVATSLLTLEENRVFVPVIPASRDAVKALEKVKVETMNSEKSFGETCIICFDKLFLDGVVEVTRMPCKHLYHGGCIVQWLQRNHVCPVCRFKMPVGKILGFDLV